VISPEPPAAPVKVNPRPYPISAKGQELGQFGTKLYTLVWQETSGLSNLTSTVEISTDPNFPANPVFVISGITGTSVTVDLEPGYYYWRVKSTGSDGTASDWKAWPYRIEVDFITAWFYALAGAFLLFIVILLVIALVSSQRKPRNMDYYPYNDGPYYR
jgi:hypothetical protein